MSAMHHVRMPWQTVPTKHGPTLFGLGVGLILASAGVGVMTWYSTGWFYERWDTPALVAGLVIVVLLCTAAGVLVERRWAVSES